MTKAPKQYQCLNPACGCKSSRCKVLRLSGMGFATCFKCQGRVKETDEWLAWYRAENEKYHKAMQEKRTAQT